MKLLSLPRNAVLACGMTLAVAQTVSAAPQDYQFQVVEPEFRQGGQVNLTIAITDLRTNTPVVDATIIAVQMDMSPDGMAGMRTPVTPVGTGRARPLRLCRQPRHGRELASCHRRPPAR